jgi:hypothetical protein
LTVTAAWPWGELIKSHGALDQIRLHRAAANPLAVPPLGSAQLFVISPNSNSKNMGQPVLVDWLLIDAPLQNLRQNDASWRLRITVNGESFLVDQQTPLWLSGWRSGANALLWELVDGRGEPLNPPFNSIVSEMYLEDSKASKPFNSPWLSGRINSDDLAVLLGNASPVTPVPQVQEEPLPSMAVQPENFTSLLQDKDNNEIQTNANTGLLELPAEGVANGESPEELGHGPGELQLDSGPDPSAPADPINPIADPLTLSVPNLETPPLDPLPDGPAKPETPLAEAGSMGSKADRRERERDRPATALPDTASPKDIELEDLKDFLSAAGEGVDLAPPMGPPASGGGVARLGQGLRRRLGPS